MSSSKCLKALFFDVFGTVVDWQQTVAGYLELRAKQSVYSKYPPLVVRIRNAAWAVSWSQFTQTWRDSYTNFCQSHDPGQGFITVDQHHYDSLKRLLEQHDLDDLWNEQELQEISRVWHFLPAHPDSSPGLEELNSQGYITCTLSNGNMSLLENLTKNGWLPFQHLFSAEHFGAYKPSPKTYLGAVEKLGLKPEECAMVASHLEDLAEARKCGLRTIYVERPKEEAWSLQEVVEASRKGWVDMWIWREDRTGGGGLMEIEGHIWFWKQQP